MFSRSVSAMAAKNAEQDPAGAGGVVDAGQRAGEHLQDQAVGGEVVGEGGELGGVAAEPLHLVDGEEHAAVRGVGLDLAGGARAASNWGRTRIAGGDLLGEDLVAGDAVRAERVQLGLQFLGEGASSGRTRSGCRRPGCRRSGSAAGCRAARAAGLRE